MARADLLAGRRFKLDGITDDVCSCELCGKQELKCTMRLIEMDADGNEVGAVYYGRDCGAAALGWGVSADRAEKLARGTAKLVGEAAYAAWSAWHKWLKDHLEQVYADKAPAVLVLDGVKMEVWNAYYGGRNDAGWRLIAGYDRVFWRVAP